MSLRSLAFFVGGKYFIKNFSAKLFQVATESGGIEFNHALALSHKEYGKSFSIKASSVTPCSLNESHTSMNNRK